MPCRISASRGEGSPRVIGASEPDTDSIQYRVADEGTRKVALIEVVLDFDPRSARISTASAERALRQLDPGRHFDRLLADGETLAPGDLTIRRMLSPGHKLGSVTYVVGERPSSTTSSCSPIRGRHGPTFPADRRMISTGR